jgi:hypothetical protein
MTGIIDGLNKCTGKDESPEKERMCNVVVYVDPPLQQALKTNFAINLQSLALLLVKRCITISNHLIDLKLHCTR